MKKLIIPILALYVLSSCDNRKEYLKTLNPLPNLTILTSGNLAVLDSVKLSLKSVSKFVDYKVVIEGNNQEKEVTVKTVNAIGSGIVSFNGNVGPGTFKIGNGTYAMRYEPTAEGKTLVNLSMKDVFDNLKEYNFEVVAFSNLAPVANLQTKLIAVNDTREYSLDASGSYDRDAKFGGFISSYTFKIANKTYTSDSPTLKWIFGSAGNYEIGVTVRDSDGATSSYSTIFTVN